MDLLARWATDNASIVVGSHRKLAGNTIESSTGWRSCAMLKSLQYSVAGFVAPS